MWGTILGSPIFGPYEGLTTRRGCFACDIVGPKSLALGI